MTNTPLPAEDATAAGEQRAVGPLALVKHLRGEGFTVIDAAAHEPLCHLGEGRQPHALAVHPNGRWGYVPYMASNSLEIVDLWTLEVVDRIDRVGTAPVGATLTRAGRHLFVSSYGTLPTYDDPGLVVFEVGADGRLELIDQLPVGKAAGIVVDARNDVWVALKDANEIVRIDGTEPFLERDRIAVPGDPQDMTYAPAEGLLGVNNVESGCVTFIDVLDAAFRGTVPAPNPRGGTVVSAHDRWVVGNKDGDGVTVIDLSAVRREEGNHLDDAAEQVSLGTPTAFTDVTPDGALLAIDAYEDDRVTFLDPADLDVVARVETGQAPHHPRFSADGRVCYVPSMDADTVTVIDTTPLRTGSTEARTLTTIDVPEGAAPSGCFRTDRRERL